MPRLRIDFGLQHVHVGIKGMQGFPIKEVVVLKKGFMPLCVSLFVLRNPRQSFQESGVMYPNKIGQLVPINPGG
jgi:hypothetical protein